MEQCSNSLWLKQITVFFCHYSALSHLIGCTSCTSQISLSGEIRRNLKGGGLWRFLARLSRVIQESITNSFAQFQIYNKFPRSSTKLLRVRFTLTWTTTISLWFLPLTQYRHSVGQNYKWSTDGSWFCAFTHPAWSDSSLFYSTLHPSWQISFY